MLANTFSLTPQGHGTPISSTIRGNPVSVLHLDLFGKRVRIPKFASKRYSFISLDAGIRRDTSAFGISILLGRIVTPIL